MKKLIAYSALTLALASLLFVPPVTVNADGYGFGATLLSKGVHVGRAYVADDTPVAIVVKYIGDGGGTNISGKVAIDAGTGDLTFTDGAEGSEAASTDFECPYSTPNGGVIDVSNAACDTLGEVVDVINGASSGGVGTSSKWRAFILDGTRAASSNDTLVTISATAATAEAGLNLVWDTSVGLTDTTALQACRDMTCMLRGRGPSPTKIDFVPNPVEGLKTLLWEVSYTSNYASGTSTITILSCDTKQAISGGSETCTTVYSAAGGADDTAATKSFTTWGFPPGNDKRYLVRLTNSVAMDTVTSVSYATAYPYR